MESSITRNALRAPAGLLLLAVVVLTTTVPMPVAAKSLYVIADIKQPTPTTMLPVQAYDIGPDGKLTFQAEYGIRHRMLGAVGLAIDSDHGFLFVTYEASDEIKLLDARLMTDEGTTVATGAQNLAGVVYDHDKGLLYSIDRGTGRLYVYLWDPDSRTLTHVPGSPRTLQRATGYGIALDEIDDLLYIANGTDTVTVYDTSNWRLVDSITLERVAISIAVGVRRGLLYTGGGFAGDKYLAQYHLATGILKEVRVEPDAGVMGLGVDPDTGYVYFNTGVNNAPGGDNLWVYNAELEQIDMIPKIGNPTGLIVPGRDISYNPLGLQKTALRGVSKPSSRHEMPTVGVGDILTYGINFNNMIDITTTDVSIVDRLPREVVFVAADKDGTSGSYDSKTHTYRWLYSSVAPEMTRTLELTVQVRANVEIGTIISNTVTINSNETPPTTKRFDVVAGHNALNLTKNVLGTPEGQVASVYPDGPVPYTIQFKNNNDFAVTDILVLDALPEEVGFVSVGSAAGFVKYDPGTHTCAWSFASLEPGEVVNLQLNALVNSNLAKDTIFTNTVTVESNETPLVAASADAIVSDGPLTIRPMKIVPDIIRRTNETYEIQAIAVFSDGIGKNDIADVLPTLYPGAITANRHVVFGSATKAKVIALFDKIELLDAVPDYGQVTLTMVGTLTSGEPYSCVATVWITKFTGN